MPKSGVCVKGMCCSFGHLCPLPFAGVSVCECVFSLGKCVCEGGHCANVKHVWWCLCVNLPCVCLDYANDGECQVFVWAAVCLSVWRAVKALVYPPFTRACMCFVCALCVCARVGRDVGERYQGRHRHAGPERGPRGLCLPGWQAGGGGYHPGHQWRAHLQCEQRPGQGHAAQTFCPGAGDEVRRDPHVSQRFCWQKETSHQNSQTQFPYQGDTLMHI